MIFHKTTAIMSKQEKSMKGEIVCLLPELVSNLQKDLYFFAPEKTITFAEHQVYFETFNIDSKNYISII